MCWALSRQALLSGFGGANTAKEGEKALDQESAEEKMTRLALTAEQYAAKRAVAMAEAKKDRLELQVHPSCLMRRDSCIMHHASCIPHASFIMHHPSSSCT
jgi:hypothetical protein